MCVCMCMRMYACSITQSCPTLCDSTDCRSLGSSVCEISQARMLEWVAVSFSSVLIIVFHRCAQMPVMYNVGQCYKVEV